MPAARVRLAAKVWLRRRSSIGDGADDDHAEGDGGERAAEESHGVSGEVVEVAEGEVVEVGVVGEEGGEICAGGHVRREDGEVSADNGYEDGERHEEEEGPAQSAACGCGGGLGLRPGECAAGEQSESGERGEGVVLLACGEGEEADDDDGPEEERECGFVFLQGGGESTS